MLEWQYGSMTLRSDWPKLIDWYLQLCYNQDTLEQRGSQLVVPSSTIEAVTKTVPFWETA